ncbi:MAG: hypothetical protein ABJA76_01350 [Mucilaginibacter sp.]|jgi:hypothetical protein
MATLAAKKSFFEMSPEEIHEHLKPVAEKAKQEAWDKGLWYSYQNELCVDDDMFIHEFKDGHKELIKLGDETGKFKVLKVLNA